MTLYAAAIAWLVCAAAHTLGIPLWLCVPGVCAAALISPAASRRRCAVNLVVVAISFPSVRLVHRPAPDALTGAWRDLRAAVDRGLRSTLPTTEALFGSTLLFGGRHALPAALARDLEDSGLAHMAIVSAFNLV